MLTAYTTHFLNFQISKAFHAFSHDALTLTLCSLLISAKLFLYPPSNKPFLSFSLPGWLKEKTQQQVDVGALMYCSVVCKVSVFPHDFLSCNWAVNFLEQGTSKLFVRQELTRAWDSYRITASTVIYSIFAHSLLPATYTFGNAA